MDFTARVRTDANAVRLLKVRNADGDMVPLGAVAEIRDHHRLVAAGDQHW